MRKSINIMQIVFSLKIGGLENLVVNLVKKMDTAKYNISVCCLKEGGILRRELTDLGIPVFTEQKHEGVDYTLVFRLARLLKQKKIDLIHTHNPAPWLYGAIAARIAGVKVVVHTEHSNLFSNQKRLMLAEKFLSKITDIIISDSEKVTQHLIDKQRISPQKIRTILNGIDIEKFQKEINIKNKKRELGIKEGGLVIGIVARLEPIKDHLTLLDAFNRISKKIPEVVLVVVGDGSLRESLKNRIEKLKIGDKVYFLGVRNDISEIIRIFDIFVLSSLSEGLSLSLLEAMAVGLPVVATDVGGNPEVIVDGITGLLVPPNDPESMAKAIIEILSNEKLSREMGLAGRKKIEEKFSLERMTLEYIDIYKSLYDG